VAKTALPALNGNNSAAGGDDIELEGVRQAELNAVVDLDIWRMCEFYQNCRGDISSHRFAIGEPQHHGARGNGTDSSHGGGAAVGLPARYG
jgi:hypothetical protein